jgi:hypothetical protein
VVSVRFSECSVCGSATYLAFVDDDAMRFMDSATDPVDGFIKMAARHGLSWRAYMHIHPSKRMFLPPKVTHRRRW